MLPKKKKKRKNNLIPQEHIFKVKLLSENKFAQTQRNRIFVRDFSPNFWWSQKSTLLKTPRWSHLGILFPVDRIFVQAWIRGIMNVKYSSALLFEVKSNIKLIGQMIVQDTKRWTWNLPGKARVWSTQWNLKRLLFSFSEFYANVGTFF